MDFRTTALGTLCFGDACAGSRLSKNHGKALPCTEILGGRREDVPCKYEQIFLNYGIVRFDTGGGINESLDTITARMRRNRAYDSHV